MSNAELEKQLMYLAVFSLNLFTALEIMIEKYPPYHSPVPKEAFQYLMEELKKQSSRLQQWTEKWILEELEKTQLRSETPGEFLLWEELRTSIAQLFELKKRLYEQED